MYNHANKDEIVEMAIHMVLNNATVRSTAREFQCSKSNVHKRMVKILPDIDYALYEKVNKVITSNKKERHLRGGAVTSRKWKLLKSRGE